MERSARGVALPLLVGRVVARSLRHSRDRRWTIVQNRQDFAPAMSLRATGGLNPATDWNRKRRVTSEVVNRQ
jgi:hypothetical protein